MNSYDEKNQSIKTNPENDTDDKDMKTVIFVFYMFKMIRSEEFTEYFFN